MQDINVKEQIIMNITRHRSVDAVRKYKMPNDQQKINTLQQLISTYNIKNQESQNQVQNINQEIYEPVQQIQDYNKKPLQTSQITNLESQDLPINIPFNKSSKEEAPKFNNCHFQNVNFYFK